MSPYRVSARGTLWAGRVSEVARGPARRAPGRSNRPRARAQRELSLLYVRFYGALLGGIFLSYQLQRRAPVTLTQPISPKLRRRAPAARHASALSLW